jgi:hypothetical protein
MDLQNRMVDVKLQKHIAMQISHTAYTNRSKERMKPRNKRTPHIKLGELHTALIVMIVVKTHT